MKVTLYHSNFRRYYTRSTVWAVEALGAVCHEGDSLLQVFSFLFFLIMMVCHEGDSLLHIFSFMHS